MALILASDFAFAIEALLQQAGDTRELRGRPATQGPRAGCAETWRLPACGFASSFGRGLPKRRDETRYITSDV